MSATPPGADRRRFELLARATALPAAEREALLRETDPELAAEVRRLLDADRTEDGLRRPASTPRPDPPGPPEDDRLLPGSRVGPFVVREPLGAGGMGDVYLADQRQPIAREVALKILRLPLAGAGARRRFLAECQAMARLEHPHVGRILDAGTTDDGTPYLAMEHIPGPPLTDYCAQRSLALDDRLRLFVAVCRAVEHAHHRFLLHRDIKPSNILVAEVDGRPVPKLIDFGIAKRLDDTAGEPITRHGIVGTPQYMSPEALAGERELGTHSDVFSLGVVLYQLLTGRLPWRGDDAGLATVLERRRTEEARRPSALAVPELSSRRLRGDLDAVVLKAVALEPEDRYGSAAELADDLERFLAHEPVHARFASRLDRLRKALVRHRSTALTAAAVALALTAGTVAASVGLLRARAEAAAAARARDESQAVIALLTSIFDASGVYRPGADRPPSEITALEILDRGAERIERELGDRPRVQARMELVVGRVYRQLGVYDASRRLLVSALARLEREPEEDRALLAEVLGELGSVELRRADRPSARQVFERLLTLCDGPSQDERRQRADTLGNLGRVRRLEGDFAGSAELLREAIGLHETLGLAPTEGLITAVTNLGVTFFAEHRWADAEAQYRRALNLARPALPPGHPILAQIADNLAAALASQGRLAEAATSFAEALAERRRMLGDHHPSVAQSLNNLGALERDLGRAERAEAYHREALAIRRSAYGEDHPETAWSLDNLARALGDLGRFDEAIALERRALAVRLRHHGPDHPDVAASREFLAQFEAAQGEG